MYDIGLFEVSCEKLREKLLRNATNFSKRLLDTLTLDMKVDIDKTTIIFLEMRAVAGKKVNSIDEISQINAYVE